MLQPYRPLPAARQIGCVPRPSPRIAAFAARMSPLVTNRRAARADARIRRVPPRSRTIPRAHARHDPRAHLPQMRRPTPRNSTFGAHPTHPPTFVIRHESRHSCHESRRSSRMPAPHSPHAATRAPKRHIRRKRRLPTFVTNREIRGTKVDIRHESPHRICRECGDSRPQPPDSAHIPPTHIRHESRDSWHESRHSSRIRTTFAAHAAIRGPNRHIRRKRRLPAFVTNRGIRGTKVDIRHESPHRICRACGDSRPATPHSAQMSLARIRRESRDSWHESRDS